MSRIFQNLKSLILLIIFLICTVEVHAEVPQAFQNLADQYQNTASTKPEGTSEDMPHSSKSSYSNPFSNKTRDFFPIPIFETRPDEGQSYGLMPVMLLSEKESKAISIILAAIGQYNSTVKWSGASIAYWFPNPTTNPDESFEFYFEYGQKFYRELSLRYNNPRFLDDYYLESKFLWLKTPFTRFYGFGANTQESGQSNYVSRDFSFDTTFGRYLTHDFRISLREYFLTTDLLNRAFPNVDDTLTRFGAQPGVVDSTNLVHSLLFTYDNRPNGNNSKKGTYIEGTYFFSHKALGSDTNFQGFSFEGIQLVPLFNERTITALRVFVQDMYGSGIPFYLQSRLGGQNEMRSFIPNRFTDTGKILFTWEQRIKVLGMTVFGVPVEFYADPYVEVGRVFNHLNHLGFDNVQPVVGLGLRAFVPPNVVARVDTSLGTEGYAVYTVLGYAF